MLPFDSAPTRAEVGVVGRGQMGTALAARLQQTGYFIRVFGEMDEIANVLQDTDLRVVFLAIPRSEVMKIKPMTMPTGHQKVVVELSNTIGNSVQNLEDSHGPDQCSATDYLRRTLFGFDVVEALYSCKVIPTTS